MAKVKGYYFDNPGSVKYYVVLSYGKYSIIVENNSSITMMNNNEYYNNSVISSIIKNNSSIEMKNISGSQTLVTVRNRSMAIGTNVATTTKDLSSI